MQVPGAEEYEIFTPVHDVYPLIDPKPHYSARTFKDKVVIITGGSTGIGANTALFYAKAGARVIINARRAENLEKTKASIEEEVPNAQIVVAAGDIADSELSKSMVKTAVEKWGRVDIVLANSGMGYMSTAKFDGKDLLKWWRTQEVNVLGTVNIVHAAIPELLKTKGQILMTSSMASHIRVPFMLDYSLSKHTLNRFAEILALEYPELAIYSVHPGNISTPMSDEGLTALGMKGAIEQPDTTELPAATFLWLTARNAEWLSGKYIDATWDLNEVLAKKDEIVKDNLFVTKLAGPNKA